MCGYYTKCHCSFLTFQGTNKESLMKAQSVSYVNYMYDEMSCHNLSTRQLLCSWTQWTPT